MTPKTEKDTVSHAAPFYTSFNFHKMKGHAMKEDVESPAKKANESH